MLNLLLPHHIASSSSHVYQWLEACKNIRGNHCHSYMNNSNCIHPCSNMLINPTVLHLYSLVCDTQKYVCYLNVCIQSDLHISYVI